MKIERFDLIAYGGFSNSTLHLGQGQQGLHIIYGDNEAGKSTALRALQGWLFGIDQRCEDTYLHGSKLLRVGGQLTLSDGRSLSFIRRKGNKSTLLDTDNQTKLADTILQPFLLGLDLQTFQQLHGMNHQKLQEGGEALLSSSSTTGQALFGAAIGSTQLQKIMRQLDTDAKNIFIPRGKNPCLNLSLQKLAEGKRHVRAHALKQSFWQKLVDEHAEQGEKLKTIGNIIHKLEQQQKLYERLQRTRVPLKQREEVLQQLQELQGLAQLNEHFEQQFYQNEKLTDQSEENLERIDEDITTLKVKIEKIQPQRKILSLKDEIKELYQRQSEQQANARQYVSSFNTIRELENKCLQQLQDLASDAHELQQIDTFGSFLNYQQTLDRLLKDEQKLNNEEQVYDETGDSLACEQEKLEQEYNSALASSTESLSSLEAALEKALQFGNLEEQCLQQEQLCLQQRQNCQRQFAQIGRFRGQLSSLEYLILPDTGCLERYQSLFHSFKQTNDGIKKEQRAAEQRYHELQKRLEGFTGSLTLPETAQLTQLRQQRDQKWEQLKEAILNNEHLYNYELLNFEKQLHESDQLADQFCKYAEQIQQRQHCQEELKHLEHKLQHLKILLEDESEKLKKEELNWRENWPSEIQPLAAPEHMRHWLEKVQQLIAAYQKLQQEETQAQVLQQRYKKLCDELKKEMQSFCSEQQTSLSLATLIIQCKHQLKKEQQRQHSVAELKKQIENNKEKQKQLQKKQERIGQQRFKLQQSWQSIQKTLKLDETSSVEDALHYLHKLHLLHADYQRYKEKNFELEHLKSKLTDFSVKLKGCLQRLGYEAAPKGQKEKTEWVDWLHKELQHAQEQESQVAALCNELKTKQHLLTVAEEQCQAAAQQTKQFCKQLGIEKREQIRPLLEQIKKRDSLQRKCRELQAEIIRSGDGYTIKELELELAKVSLDELENNDIEHTLKETRGKYQQHYEEQVNLAAQMRELEQKSAEAADEQQRNKQYMSDIEQQAQEYLRLQFAKIILENQIRDYTEKHQDPLLKRASQFFQRLTLNNYSHLKDDLDDHNQPLLFAVNHKSQAVELSNMSDGARDQLYLALRLACLEQQYEDRESLPLIVDDILISFDDQRSKAALTTLADFASSTQVILFTHHRRILEQARQITGSASGVFFHTLEQQQTSMV